MQKTEQLLKVLKGQPVIPVLLIDNAKDAVPLARALAAGGLPAIEITLRTKDALDAIKRVAGEVENCIVGAGTILDTKQFEKAEKAGSKFIVSPGCTKDLRKVAADSDVPLLPGAITPSEVMEMFAHGYSVLKFFPAEQAGGVAMLKAFRRRCLARCSARPAASLKRTQWITCPCQMLFVSVVHGSRQRPQ